MAYDNELFDLSLEEDVDSYDPLADVREDGELDDAPAESGVITVDPKEFLSSDQLAREAEAMQTAPVQERIALLFDHMRPFRKTLKNILAATVSPIPNAELVDKIASWQMDNRSVYSSSNLCMMLVRAGALRRLTSDGQDYESVEKNAEPERVVIDGVEYLKPATMPVLYWAASPEGVAVVNADAPSDRLRRLFEDESVYRKIYRIVLEEAMKEYGATQKVLGKLINGDPLVQKPRMYAMRFVDRLDEAGAVEWRNGAWHATATGLGGLSILVELSDPAVFEA